MSLSKSYRESSGWIFVPKEYELFLCTCWGKDKLIKNSYCWNSNTNCKECSNTRVMPIPLSEVL